MTGAEMKHIRHGLSEAIGRRLSLADMAKLCGLKDPEGNGRQTWRKWEEGEGPSGPVAVLLSIYAYAIDNFDMPSELVNMRAEILRRLDD
jgi:hypothetical protein